jgi:hypothetical protein
MTSEVANIFREAYLEKHEGALWFLPLVSRWLACFGAKE